jgi:hypothetical protein
MMCSRINQQKMVWIRSSPSYISVDLRPGLESSNYDNLSIYVDKYLLCGS